MGEPGELALAPTPGAARAAVVLLVDVSGSMSAYADALLRLAHRFVAAASRRRVEVVHPRHPADPRHPRAAARATPTGRSSPPARPCPDWSGGTRLGETLRVFLDRWGQRGMARGAVVVVFSDGWERGDAAAARRADARGCSGSPTAWSGSTRTAARPATSRCSRASRRRCPHVDDFVAGHSLAAFEELMEVVGRA